LLRLGRVDEAVQAFRPVVAEHPAEMFAVFGLGEALARQGNMDEALPTLDQVLALDPNHVPSLIWRGRLDADRGHWAEAEAWFRRALAVDAQNIQAQFRLALAIMMRGRFRESFIAFMEGVRMARSGPEPTAQV